MGPRKRRALGARDFLKQLPEQQAAHDDASDGETSGDRCTERAGNCGAHVAQGGREVRQDDGRRRLGGEERRNDDAAEDTKAVLHVGIFLSVSHSRTQRITLQRRNPLCLSR